MVKKKKNLNKSVKVFTKKNNDSSTWMYISLVLVVILAAMVIADFMDKESVESLIEDVQELKASTASEDLKQALSTVEETLEPYKEVEVQEEVSEKVTGDAVEVNFYVMSQCPYGTQVEDAIYPVLEKLGDNIDFNLDFIVTDLGGGEFQSLHGEPEALGNIVQLCAAEYEPDKYMDMIICQNKNAAAIPGNWESCASDEGLDVESIKACYEGDEGKQLLSESALRSTAAQARGSPTIYIAGELYQGGRTEADFMTAICNAYEGERPAACSDIPVPNTVEMTIVNDERCDSCDTSQLVAALKGLFPGLKTTVVDAMSSEGQALIGEFGIALAPAFILDSIIEEEASFNGNAQLQTAFQKIGDSYKIIDDATGASWIIDDEARDAYLESLKIPQTEKPEVELFVMSHCPYGTQSEKGMLPAALALGDSIDFKIRFVYYAMHGEKEIYEQLNQYCIQEEQPEVYLDYLACFLKDETGSEACMAETGVDVEKMNTCAQAADEEFGITTSFEDQASWLSGRFPLFNTDKELNEQYGVGGSPTLIINGRSSSAGRDAQSYLTAICEAFTEEARPDACDSTLDSSQPSAGFGYGTAAAATAAGCGV
ncbi:hypothetical protein C0585_02410 [Candidatus Woesearchaeota archaeon]|nr:MAG: hypothetical protein C0585_02410 [Candidatus Woesearchaeota archaeon]